LKLKGLPDDDWVRILDNGEKPMIVVDAGKTD